MENRGRDGRRRRILERGSDRLALITGKIQSLPSAASENSQISSAEETDAGSHSDDAVPASVLTQCDPRIEAAKNPLHTESEIQPVISSSSEVEKRPDRNSAIEALISSTSEAVRDPSEKNSKIHPSISSAVQDTSRSASNNTRSVGARQSRIFTASGIISSITISENVRLVCSVIIALLVVLSSSSDTSGNSIIKTIAASRPLFLVLLTDITIVLGLLLGNGVAYRKVEEAGKEEFGMADGISKALELALVSQRAISAAFMDCSVCAVLLISGLSLRRYWS